MDSINVIIRTYRPCVYLKKIDLKLELKGMNYVINERMFK